MKLISTLFAFAFAIVAYGLSNEPMLAQNEARRVAWLGLPSDYEKFGSSASPLHSLTSFQPGLRDLAYAERQISPGPLPGTGTPNPKSQEPLVSTNDANRAQDEVAIRKLIADHNEAFDKHDGSAIAYFTDDADTRNIVGAFFTGKAEIQKLEVVLDKGWANVQRTETIQRIRFLMPKIALVDSTGDATGYVIAENGTKVPPQKGGMSVKVVVKKDGRWLIAAMRNGIPVRLAPPGSFPGTGTPNPEAQEVPATADTNRSQNEGEIRTFGLEYANRAQDEAAIRSLIARRDAAFNRHDGSGIVLFTDDADTRNIGGSFFTGKAEIEKVGSAINKSFANIQRTETIQRIRFLTPDIALVDNVADDTGYMLTESGNKLPPSKGGMSFKVLVKRDERWLITAMRNDMPFRRNPTF